MQMIAQYLKRKSVLVTLTTAGVLSSTASLALVGGVGGTDIRVDVRSEVWASTTISTAFVDLAGANVVVVVPAGTSRLLIARFTAELQCFGSAAGLAWCSVAIVATNAAGASVQLDPASGIDYAFDSNPAGTADDLWEGNAMERSKRLGPGTYRIRVLRAVRFAGTTFRLDDWHFSVEMRLAV